MGHPGEDPGFPEPIDPQVVQDQDEMTWDDYRPIPGESWADPSLTPERGFRIALVAIDFSDQPFVITLPKGSGSQGRGVALGGPSEAAVGEAYTPVTFTLTNTGAVP